MRTAEKLWAYTKSVYAQQGIEAIQNALDEAIAHGMTLSAEVVSEREKKLEANGAKELIREHYHRQAILTARDNKVWRKE